MTTRTNLLNVKRRLSRLDQYVATNSKYIGGECKLSRMTSEIIDPPPPPHTHTHNLIQFNPPPPPPPPPPPNYHVAYIPVKFEKEWNNSSSVNLWRSTSHYSFAYALKQILKNGKYTNIEITLNPFLISPNLVKYATISNFKAVN